MDVDILYRPSYSLAVLKLAGNEEIRAESGAMVSMSQGVVLESKATGGLLKSLGPVSVGGVKSFFQTTFKAPVNGGEVTVAPSLPGDQFWLQVTEPMLLQSGAYVASEMSVQIDTKWGGAKTFSPPLRG